MYTVTLILPKDRTILQDKYTEILAEIIAEQLTHDELGYLIEEFQRREKIVQ